MKKVVPVLLDMHKDDFTLKGKRVSIRDLEKTTRNINYDDFFKARISKDSDGYDINFFCKDGTDILSFIILGMSTSLSSLGVFDTEFGFKSGAHDYLYDLADFLTSRGYPVVSTSDDFDKTLSALNRIYLENDVTLQTIKDMLQNQSINHYILFQALVLVCSDQI